MVCVPLPHMGLEFESTPDIGGRGLMVTVTGVLVVAKHPLDILLDCA